MKSSLANHSLAAEGSAINMGIAGPLVYHGDDGDVAPKHHHQWQDQGHGQHKKEVKELLKNRSIYKHVQNSVLNVSSSALVSPST